MNAILNLSTACAVATETRLVASVTEREANLTTALVVFVILSVFLTVFVVMLFANKKFRAFFFRTDADGAKNKKEKREKKAKAEKAEAAPARRAPRPRQKREQAASAPYLDEVPTVPLGGFSSASDEPDIMRRTSDAYIGMAVSGEKRAPAKNRAKSNDTLDKIPTVVISQTPPASKNTAPTAKTDKKSPSGSEKSKKPAAKPNAADNRSARSAAKPTNKK